MTSIPDGDYSVMVMTQHLGQNKMLQMPLLVADNKAFIVTEWANDDESDFTTKSAIAVDLSLLAESSGIGCDFMYQGPQIELPDSFDA